MHIYLNKLRMKISLVIMLAFFATSVFTQQYKPIDAKSEIKFTIKNFGLNTSGTLSGLKGDINFDPAQIASSKFNVSVDVNTINTGIDMRDNHLKKEEYFNAEKYPALSFVSTEIKAADKDYTVTGQLTIKGITKTISFPFTAAKQDNGMLFTGNFSINRKDFSVGGGSAVMGNNVDIGLKVFAQ